MAYWQRRKRKGNPVQVWYMKDGEPKGLPRKLYRHLDTEPDQAIDEWVARWGMLNEVHKVRPELTQLPVEWHEYVEKFCEELALPPKARDKKTISDHHRHLLVALPFFADMGCNTLAEFPMFSRKLYQWLLERGKSENRIWKINLSVGMFWEYLDQKGLVEGQLKLAGGRRTERKTPLKITIPPQDILSADLPRKIKRARAKTDNAVVDLQQHRTARDDIRLIALIGYFFSLRPQEVFALRPIDFATGPAAKVLECCKVMEQAGFWNKLAVHIHRQKVGTTFKPPKKDSIGWVACFDEKGAREIFKLLSGKPPEELLFPAGSDRYYKMWKQSGVENTVTKDMRRASLYHLGNNTSLPVVALKNHARHKNIETTMLYTRRPEELLSDAEWKLLDMDA